ncbi:MAG: hypothetical protein ACRD0A_20685 [Acidimicrobiales bacterium]
MAIAARLEALAESSGLDSYTGAARRCRGVVDDDPDLLVAAVEDYRRAGHPLDEGLAAEDAAVSLIRASPAAERRRARAA